MHPAFYDDPSYRKKQSEITKCYYTLHPRIKTFITRTCSNSTCNLSFQVSKPSDPKIYCGHSCATSINNRTRKRIKKIYPCLSCDNRLDRSSAKYCSIKCQNNHRHSLYISKWKSGLEDGNRGIATRIISRYLKRYLREKYQDRCSICGWYQKNPITNVVPLEIDHIDGNSENNKEENLRLICPNCHSLTPYFRNLNKGNGRAWRIKYLKKSINSSLETSTLLK